MSRVLAYCGFQHSPEISLPARGVQRAPVEAMSFGNLRLLWSEVEWPFDAKNVQRHAVEFHEVVRHIFNQAAVIPFRLLSVFDDRSALMAFAGENQARFVEDLERLKAFVQMECVIYPAPSAAPVDRSSGRVYLEQKAAAARSSAGFAQAVRDAVAHLSPEVRVREGKNGTRIFVLVERGGDAEFRRAVNAMAIPEHMSRRISGPWPAAEFLSERVKAPQIAGEK
jgi:hypothetical protein